jgi:hypothetical protein
VIDRGSMGARPGGRRGGMGIREDAGDHRAAVAGRKGRPTQRRSKAPPRL